MSSFKFSLEARSPLDLYQRTIGSVTLEEVSDLAILSIAAPLDGEAALHKVVDKKLGAQWPSIGTSTLTPHGHRLLGLQADMIFAVFAHPGGRAERSIQDQLGADCYVTDQSDAFVVLAVAGSGVKDALERICPLDLSSKAFPVGCTLQTSMEHIGVTISKQSEDCFWLLAATSYAGSLCHAMETAVIQTQ